MTIYLIDQFVTVEGEKSNILPVISEVPQGSVRTATFYYVYQ